MMCQPLIYRHPPNNSSYYSSLLFSKDGEKLCRYGYFSEKYEFIIRFIVTIQRARHLVLVGVQCAD